MMEKTLFLGNGFSLAVFKDVPSWDDLLSPDDKAIKNYPIRYEIGLHNENEEENKYKEKLSKRLLNLEIRSNVEKLDSISTFGEILKKHNINNILTTNFDDGIAYVLVEKCGYSESYKDGSEKTYSIHRYTEYVNNSTKHTVKIWKIHGDVKNYNTMQLGLNQYGGFLSIIRDYVKGQYKFTEKKESKTCPSIEDKLKNESLSRISWIDLFFFTDVYIAGFSMSYSEIDIWWLLTRRFRIGFSNEKLQNKIIFIISKKNNNDDSAKDNKCDYDKSVLRALESLGVALEKVNRSDDFLKNMWEAITRFSHS